MRSMRLTRRSILAAVVVALALPGAAHAALLGDALPGVLSPEGENVACDPNAYQAFQPFGDSAYYVLMPGGAFEGGPAWELKKGAKIVKGNEPYYIHASGDRYSLYLPEGAYATTPPMCFSFADWHLRLFVRGSEGANLRVTVIVRSLLGVVSTLDAGTVDPAYGWQPSPKVYLLLSNLGGLVSTDTIQFRFTALRGDVQLDDSYLDPWKNT